MIIKITILTLQLRFRVYKLGEYQHISFERNVINLYLYLKPHIIMQFEICVIIGGMLVGNDNLAPKRLPLIIPARLLKYYLVY